MEGALRNELALRRIATTLAALAALAERAGSLPLPLRWLVLAILRPAEAVARSFVVGATGLKRPGFDAPPEIGGSPLDAACLAWRFRVLAAALGALLRLVGRFHCRNNAHGDPASLAPRARRLHARSGGWREKPVDTS